MCTRSAPVAVIVDLQLLGTQLERSHEVHVRRRLKFRLGQIVYMAFTLDLAGMGFGFPKEERPAVVASGPRAFQMPSATDLRLNGVEADLAALAPDRGPGARGGRVADGRPREAVPRPRPRPSPRPGRA